MRLQPPYLVFLGDAISELDAKTGHGVAHWRPEDCLGQLRFANCKADTGLPDMDIRQAVGAGAQSLLIGVAPTGGRIKPDWISTLADALESGLDVVSGMHTRLDSVPRLVNAASRSGRRLVDIRVPPGNIPVASGRPRAGNRLLTVGTDCAVGKKYTALSLHRSMLAAGFHATFRATGQTGIMIAGSGIPMDAVVADFISGAAEMLSPESTPGHWDVIEGQGSLFHPGYAAVTLGLLHGSQPDALVLCHQAGREHIDEYAGYPIPSLAECMERYLREARMTNPGAHFVGISINTRDMGEPQRQDYLGELARMTGLPCVDPLENGVEALLAGLAG